MIIITIAMFQSVLLLSSAQVRSCTTFTQHRERQMDLSLDLESIKTSSKQGYFKRQRWESGMQGTMDPGLLELFGYKK